MTEQEGTFDELCLSQVGKTTEIRKILAEYHKTNKRSRTSTSVTNKMQKLEEIWKAFEETEAQIQKHADFDEGHDYFKESCYDKTEDWYKLTKATLSDHLNSLAAYENKADNPFYIPPPTTSQKLVGNPNIQETQDTENGNESNTNAVRFRSQEDKQGSISRVIESVKEGVLATASRTFLEHKLETLNRHWEAFEATHNEIIKYATQTELESDYFTNNTFTATENNYEETAIAIQEQLNERLSKSLTETQQNNHQCQNTSLQYQSSFSLIEAKSLIGVFNGNMYTLKHPQPTRKTLSSA